MFRDSGTQKQSELRNLPTNAELIRSWRETEYKVLG